MRVLTSLKNYEISNGKSGTTSVALTITYLFKKVTKLKQKLL